jgi:hypothetical protein
MYGGYTLTCAPVAVSYVRTNPGMFDRYMEYLNTAYKTNLEAVPMKSGNLS